MKTVFILLAEDAAAFFKSLNDQTRGVTVQEVNRERERESKITKKDADLH